MVLYIASYKDKEGDNMLELKNLKKYYTIGETTTKALDGVSVAFRKKEFVAILGPSGSGKTTMLNVTGGLDRYDSGDLIINGKSTKTFKDNHWDAYRNNSIGFIFQSYNLIGHLGILDNVELGMTLSGVPKEEKRKKAKEALIRVGLKDHMNKKPNQLSGGQMQRVAIARALANDPDILLCDEPTGALDTETSIQIMELIQELSKEKLVIMVTHNPNLAHKYVDRVIEFSDGKIISDSNPYKIEDEKESFKLKSTKMKFVTALKLSFNNIRTKKGRTLLTSFASSIGIIGIAAVLSLSNGFKKQVDNTQQEAMAQYPITISQSAIDLNTLSSRMNNKETENKSNNSIIVKGNEFEDSIHMNKIDNEYLNYIDNLDSDLIGSVVYTRPVNLNLLRKIDGEVKTVSLSNYSSLQASQGSMMGESNVSTFPVENENSFLKDNYNLVKGDYPKSSNELVLVLDEEGKTNMNALVNFGFDVKNGDEVPYENIIGLTAKLVNNNDYYTQIPTGNFIPNNDLDSVYNTSNNEEIKIVGIIQPKENSNMAILSPGIAYSDELIEKFIDENKDSKIVKTQKDSSLNVMTNQKLDETTKESLIGYLGGSYIPNGIMVYPNDYKSKDSILDYLDSYNDGKSAEDKIIYTDLSSTMTELTGGLMDAITYVLVAFAAISLVTSMIMISIITYTSVIERTKEIGVLKALGARKKDITRVFDAETCILGVSSGVLGVLIAWLLTFPINNIIYKLTELENVAQLNPKHAIVLVIVSTVLTIIGGHVPARMAAKKDAAVALRTE